MVKNFSVCGFKESLNLRPKMILTILEVELVEVHSLHQVSESFRLKRGESRVTDPPVSTTTHTDIIQAFVKVKKKKNPADVTHVYASKSPLLMASISCSVIFMISCLRAEDEEAEEKEGKKKERR